MLVIGVIGPKASGKETIARYIAEKYDGNAHSHSEILGDVLDILGIEQSRANEMKLVSLRKNFGEDVLTNALNKKVREENKSLQIITGIRFQNELDNIRKFENNALIYIDAPLELRYQRQLLREQKADDQTMNFETFKELEHAETEKQIKELGKQADYNIMNLGDEVSLNKQVEKVMAEILQAQGK